MEFARKQLEKYGWTDGKGLGRKEDGISEPLKPKLKRSITGVGYDPAKDFTEHWWSELYNKAASNVQVEDNKGKTKRIKQKDDNFKITNNTYLLKGKNKSNNANSEGEYKDFFVRTEVFENDGAKIVRVQESESSDEDDAVVQMTDEQLFAACNGRTAHKGARHGLRALGKLARIEQQEQLLLQQSRFNGYSHAKKNKNKSSDNQVVEDTLLNKEQDLNMLKTKKKKKKHCSLNEYVNNNLEETKDSDNVAIIDKDVKKSKKSKKQLLNNGNDIDLSNNGDILKTDGFDKSVCDIEAPENENVAIIENNMNKKPKKRKQEKLSIDASVDLSNEEDILANNDLDTNKEVIDNDNNINCEIEMNHQRKSNKKRKIKTKDDIDIKIKDNRISLEENSISDVKIKNKKKRKNNSDVTDEVKVTIEVDNVIIDKISKKIKKKSKSSE